MTDYMRANNDASDEQTDPFNDTPFRRIPPAEGIKDEWVETILQGANKIHKAAKQRGNIEDEDAVIESLSKPSNDLWINKKGFYLNRVGPVAQTCDSLEWASAYTMDLDDAPHYKSDEFVDAASELRVPDSRALKLGPKFIKAAYRVLYNHTEATGRPMHPLRIKSETNVVLSDRGYSQAFRYLNELPGVEPPETGGLAWTYVEQDAATTGEQSHV